MVPWIILVTALIGALLWHFMASPDRLGSAAKRWTRLEAVQSDVAFTTLLRPRSVLEPIADSPPDWRQSGVSVYSVPTVVPPHPLPTLMNLADSGQAHAIDYLANAKGESHSWEELRQALIDANANVAASKDPFRFDRVLVATVTRGASWTPGDRMVWTRVFVQPINFGFAGYTVASTENETVKITSVEAANTRKFSAEIGLTIPGLDGPKASIGPSSENSVKTTADISAQYERLGIDITGDFLRIIRESETGGDVLGNTTVSLSILTDPITILKKYPQDEIGAKTPGDNIVLVVTAANLQNDAQDLPPEKASITALPQVPLPHCALRARVWMLFEKREIREGREFYDESRQNVALVRDADKQKDVVIVPADDVSPAVWAVRVLQNTEDGQPPRFLGAYVDEGETRELVFSDYGLASKMAHWVRIQHNPQVKNLKINYDGEFSLAPYKVTQEECNSKDGHVTARAVYKGKRDK